MDIISNDNALPDTIEIIWSVDDVLAVRPELSQEEGRRVLQHARDHHDANIGINWEVLEITAQILFPTEIGV